MLFLLVLLDSAVQSIACSKKIGYQLTIFWSGLSIAAASSLVNLPVLKILNMPISGYS